MYAFKDEQTISTILLFDIYSKVKKNAIFCLYKSEKRRSVECYKTLKGSVLNRIQKS